LIHHECDFYYTVADGSGPTQTGSTTRYVGPDDGPAQIVIRWSAVLAIVVACSPAAASAQTLDGWTWSLGRWAPSSGAFVDAVRHDANDRVGRLRRFRHPRGNACRVGTRQRCLRSARLLHAGHSGSRVSARSRVPARGARAQRPPRRRLRARDTHGVGVGG